MLNPMRRNLFAKELGYEEQTTFWMDFSIADSGKNAISAIRDTFNRAFKEWKSNVVYVTELCMVLNWKIWEWDSLGNMECAELYDELWRKVDDYCIENLKGDDLSYFLRTTD